MSIRSSEFMGDVVCNAIRANVDSIEPRSLQITKNQEKCLAGYFDTLSKSMARTVTFLSIIIIFELKPRERTGAVPNNHVHFLFGIRRCCVWCKPL